jgi:hypothetical protein
VHDKKAVKTLREKAVAEMSTRDINISASKNMQALALFPKVCYIYICDIDVTLTPTVNSC